MCIFSHCNNKDKYGEYCYKHRRNYLIDSYTNRIIIERWTNKCSDYLKDDILKNLHAFGYWPTENNKKQLFILLSEKINALQTYNEKDLQKIIYIQKIIKSR